MVRVSCALVTLVFCSPALAADDVETVQRELKRDGYSIDRIDGELGKQTAAAISQYQSDWEIPVTGLIDADLIARVTRVHDTTKSRMQQAENQDCRIYNRSPQARETVTYVGMCKDGRPAGKGQIEWRYILAGEWLTSSYDGMFQAGRASGEGTELNSNGDRYTGGFRNGLRHGRGMDMSLKGNSIEGVWTDGVLSGQVTVVKADGVRYEGEWRDGRANGQGELWHPTGSNYKGQFLDSQFSGYGVRTWKNGNRYEGEWLADKRHGHGTFFFVSGNRYEGAWRDDKPNGFGQKVDAELGRTFSGEWRNGCLTADGYNLAIATEFESCGF